MGRIEEQTTPLARLFSMGLRYLVDELLERLQERGWQDIREIHGYILMALKRNDANTNNDLAALLSMSKQAMSKIIEMMEREQLIQRITDAQDARAKKLILAPRGEELLASVEEIYAELEEEWAKLIGHDNIELMRKHLEDIMKFHHSGQLPSLRPT